jgi:hypothetical protein
MLSLTADELQQIMTAAQPLDPNRRDEFVTAVAAELAACTVIGPGPVHRAIAATQRQFWDPPRLTHEAGAHSKWR